MGNFITDRNGDADTSLRHISTPNDATAASSGIWSHWMVSTYSMTIGLKGHFLLYSRGPIYQKLDSSNNIVAYNTTTGGPDGKLYNPPVDVEACDDPTTPTIEFSLVQFIGDWN